MKHAICASCVGMKLDEPVLSSSKKIPKWLEKTNYVQNFIDSQTNFRVQRQKKSSDLFKVQIQDSPENAGKYVLYWASKSTKNELYTKDAKNAYGNFGNSGVSKIQKDGTVTFYIKCPQNYETVEHGKQSSETFYRHVHFVLEKKNKKEWDSQKIFTKIVTCKSNILQKKDSIIVNAIGKEFDVFHAIHLKTNLSERDFYHQVLNVIKTGKRIYNAVKNGRIKWYAVPFIVYCKNENCNASEKLVKKLYKKGLVNLTIFPKGYDGLSK